MRVLVTGGAGYIGAHLVRLLVGRGDHVVVADDLVSGVAERIGVVPLEEVDLVAADAPYRLADLIRRHDLDSVVHFAARKQAGESVERPAWYYRQNIGALAAVIEAMQATDTVRLVFSSSAAVYASSDTPVDETATTEPANPYGHTKLIGENLISLSVAAFPLDAISLRYFNVAGAGWPELGDRAALNLVPMVLEKIERGSRPQIFGTDYPTSDGSCVRDYVHVLDVAEAHLAALDELDGSGKSGHRIFNVGTGVGVSVLEMVGALLRESASSVEPEILARRAGDSASVIAAVDRVDQELHWAARFTIEDIVSSAWRAHRLLTDR